MKYYLSSRYKRYTNGGAALGMLGQTSMKAITSSVPGGEIAGTIGQLGSGLIDAFDQPDEYGQRSMLGAALSGSLQGGLLGSIGAVMQQRQAREQAKKMKFAEALAEKQYQQARSSAAIAQTPELVSGYQQAGYYANGGKLSDNYLTAMANPVGGVLKPMSSQTAEVMGPSHEMGGVKLPDMGAEVEGKETMHNDFVFSDRLGFAGEHRKIAKAIGKIESKGVMTPERVNAIERLEQRQENLKLSQEYLKELFFNDSV